MQPHPNIAHQYDSHNMYGRSTATTMKKEAVNLKSNPREHSAVSVVFQVASVCNNASIVCEDLLSSNSSSNSNTSSSVPDTGECVTLFVNQDMCTVFV